MEETILFSIVFVQLYHFNDSESKIITVVEVN
jgi:hypothetical protein